MRSNVRYLFPACCGPLLLLLVNTSFAGPATERVAFVTSVSGSGNLSTWAEASGETGALAGDAVCQARAQAAALPNAADFIAWVSTTTDDAFCRVQGLSGKRENNCGQAELPDNAGPWVLTDGAPFLPRIVEATTNGTSYYPPSLDEFGNPSTRLFLHGTNGLGEVSTLNCADWTDAAESAHMGSPTATTSSWAGFYWSSGCANARALLCLEGNSAGPEIEIPGQEGRLAFVSSITGSGNLSSWQPHAGDKTGIEAGHAICQSLASDASLPAPQNFRAWLSNGTTNAIDHFFVDGRWIRPDGVVFAENKSDLTTNGPRAPLNVTESGNYVTYSPNVWSGTETTGSASPDHCSGWTTTTGVGERAIAIDTNVSWTSFFATANCTSQFRLYCLSNSPADLMFLDGFE